MPEQQTITRRGVVAAAPVVMLGASTAAAVVVAMSGRDPVFAQIELHKSLVDKVRDYPGDDEDPAFEAICRDEEAAIQALGSMKPSTVAAAAAQLQYMADVEGCFADKSSPFWRTVRTVAKALAEGLPA